ncbi:MAG: RnfABCDGE type electron transport complex subunit B [Arenicellales bacterium]
MRQPDHNSKLAEAIDEWLPQTQCARCGFPRCLDYARALAEDRADINQCPPGGDATISGLAALLGREPRPLDPLRGGHRPRTLARIDEVRCIGCTLCIQACPVDAIVGAAKQMHTVIEAECTGCELCPPSCPVDCIDLLPAPASAAPDGSPWSDYPLDQARRARQRTRAKDERLARHERERRLDRMHREARSVGRRDRIRREIHEAVSRVRARRAQNRPPT